jgi:DNA replication protein DnaC
MLTQPLFDQLSQLKLSGFKEALQEQMANSKYGDLSFEERLGLLIDHELTLREDRRLKRSLQKARFREKASIADLDMSGSRGIEKRLILSLVQCNWLRDQLNIIVTGATGVGKTYLASALGHCVCEQGFSVRYFKTSRILHEIEMSHADGSWGRVLDQISKIRLLILDDWLRDPLNPQQTRNLLEIFDDRWKKGSAILISQIPIENWHGRMQEPTLADAVLDRIIHNAYKIDMKGESRRKLEHNVNSIKK